MTSARTATSTHELLCAPCRPPPIQPCCDARFVSPCSPVVLALHKAGGFTHVVAGASAFSKGLLPRVAALLDVAQISDVLEVRDDSTFMRPVCAGNALTVSSSRRTLSRCDDGAPDRLRQGANERRHGGDLGGLARGGDGGEHVSVRGGRQERPARARLRLGHRP